MSRVETLLDFSDLEATLTDEQKKLHAENAETFLEVLTAETSDEGIKAYRDKLSGLPEAEFPWSAVRPRHYWERDATLADAETMVRRGPPALSLILARRPDLEPELTSDEVPAPGTPGWDLFWKAIFEWDTAAIREAIGPLGWVPPEEGDVEGAIDPADPIEEPVDDAPPLPPAASSDDPEPAKPVDTTPTPMPDDSVAVADDQDGVLTKRVLIGTGVVAGLGAASALVYYLARSRPAPAPDFDGGVP